MSLRNVTLTAVAALSLGMAAHAQTTITVPLNEPGTVAPALTGPGTTVTVQPDGTSTVETIGAVPRSEVAPAAVAETATETVTDAQATPETPAPAAQMPEAATAAETGTANVDVDPTTPVPSDVAGEPPAAPIEGLPAEATEAQVTAPVPAAEGVVEADVPGTDAPAEEAVVEDVTAEEAPVEAAVEPTEAADVDAGTATEPAPEPAVEAADAEVAAEVEPPAEEIEADATAAVDAETDAAADAATGEAAEAHAAPHQEIRDVAFSFEGPFGKYDQFQLQRGLQIYTEVCAGCHGMKQVPLRTLSDPGGPGLPEDQMRAYAAEMSIVDAETGEERPREPTDMFPTVVGEGMGPDLSLMAKARAGFHGPYGTGISQLVNGIGGPEYIYSILTGYTGEEMEQAGSVLYGNSAFPGGWISMAPPLSDDSVTFEDGSPTDLDSLAKDVAAFLMWTAEPKMMDRKQAGLIAVLFLILLSVLLYLTNKRLWWPVKHRGETPGDSH